MKRKVCAAVIGCLIVIFFLFPRLVSEAATRGLLLWFQVVLPALLPFLILSSVILELKLSDTVSRLLYPIFHRLFGISQAGCYPVVIGMLSGYPLGAATVAEMLHRGRISQKEAQYILHFCNNASPMFLIEFIGVVSLQWKQPLLVIVMIYLAAWTNAGLERFFLQNRKCGKNLFVGNTGYGSADFQAQGELSLIEILDQSILHGFTVLAKVGGYIILFSILAALMEHLLPCSPEIKAVLAGILEITSGAEKIAAASFSAQSRMLLLMACSAFGGLSSVAQSASVLTGTGLSLSCYIFAKLRQALIAAGYMLLVISLFGIDVLY